MVYFDEAGNSGGNLLDTDQPSYVLLSHNYTDSETNTLLGPLLQLSNATELHFKNLKKYPKFRKAIITCINHDLIQPERIYFYYAHKHFMISLQMVDRLIEPVMHELGINIYKKGHNIATANLLNILGTSIWEGVLFEDICKHFVTWIRADTDSNCNAFYVAVEKLHYVTKPEYSHILKMLLASRHHLNSIRKSLNKYTLDTTLSCFVAHCTFWAQVRKDKPFDITFDNSKQMEYWRDLIDFLTHSLPESKVGFGSRKYKFPLPINSLKTEDSKNILQLQLADVFASSINYLAIQTINGTEDDFSREILSSRLFKSSSGSSMWPGNEMTPEELEMTNPSGIDPLDFLASAAYKDPIKYHRAWKTSTEILNQDRYYRPVRCLT